VRIRQFSSSFAAVSGVVLLHLVISPASAIDVLWTNAGSADWNTGSNWDTTIVPIGAFGDVAVIDNGGTANVTVSPADSAAGVVLGQTVGNTGTLKFRAATCWSRWGPRATGSFASERGGAAI